MKQFQLDLFIPLALLALLLLGFSQIVKHDSKKVRKGIVQTITR